MTRAVVVAFGLLALACSRTEPEGAQPGSKGETSAAKVEPPEPTDPPIVSSFTEPARTHLLVQQHAPEQNSAKLLAIDLTTSAPTIGSSRTHAASTLWQGYFASRASHDGGSRYVIVQGEPEDWRLETWPLATASEPSATIELGKVLPAAVTLIGDDVLLGQANIVAWIDLAAEPPTRIELLRRDEMFGKAYDVFARSGSWLIAIDDEVTPIYADGFRLGAGKPEHIQDFEMPSAVNGSYYAGQLVASGPADGVLYLLLHYGVMDGHGHDLTALQIRDGKLKVPAGVLINSSAGIDPPVLEEHVDRGTGKPQKLAAGEDYSEWTQIAYLPAGPRLLISAGPRGLLELPVDFGPRIKAKVIDLGGSVLDVMVLGERVLALVAVESANGELLELSADGAVERRTKLPEVYQRFVR